MGSIPIRPTTSGVSFVMPSSNWKSVGEISEAYILAKLLQLGEAVALPFGDNQRYDLVVVRGQRAIRVQCKTGRVRGGRLLFSTCNKNPFTKRKRDYRGDADVFVVYCSELNKFYWLDVDKCPTDTGILRLELPKNGQTHGIRWARDFEL
jgi:hypothetical protein